MTNFKIDVIIPFKNGANYLPDICSDLDNQSDKNFDVHFVSDHSTDSSEEYLQKSLFSFKHNLLHSQGEGPGSARNEALKNSFNEYILFIDVDDRITFDYIHAFRKKIIETKPDIVECMFHSVTLDGKIISGTDLKSFISKDDRFYSLLYGILPRVSCVKAYSRRHLNKNEARYPEGIHNGEDHVFLLKAYSNSPKVEIIPRALYKWIKNPTSLTNREITEKTICDFIKVSEMKFEILQQSLSKVTPESHHDVMLKFSRRTFKEARVIQNKILTDGVNSKPLISLMCNKMRESTTLEKTLFIIKNDSTSYWSDVMEYSD